MQRFDFKFKKLQHVHISIQFAGIIHEKRYSNLFAKVLGFLLALDGPGHEVNSPLLPVLN